MNQNEFDLYKSETALPEQVTVSVDEVPGPDRTLVYGYSRAYDAERNESTHTVHVYKADEMLHVVFYRNEIEQVYAFSGTQVLASECVPQKRAYPERCDLDFARLLRAKQHPLCFTTFNADRIRTEGPFHGSRVEETQRFPTDRASV